MSRLRRLLRRLGRLVCRRPDAPWPKEAGPENRQRARRKPDADAELDDGTIEHIYTLW